MKIMDEFDPEQVSPVRSSVRILESPADAPSCPHGPMLYFSRSSPEAKEECFYSCAAYRSPELCASASKARASMDRSQYDAIRNQVLPQLAKLPPSQRGFCRTCSLLFLEGHQGHNIIFGLDDRLIRCPSKLLSPLDHSKKEAQFIFTDRAVDAVLSMLEEIDASHVLCLACPTIFQNLKTRQRPRCASLMLDLDLRYRQFYSDDELLHYNMFNQHFFDGADARRRLAAFVASAGDRLAMVVDPPFGVKVDVLVRALVALRDLHRRCQPAPTTRDLSVFLVFPYFMEAQIVRAWPALAMTDYKVDYCNHDQFQAAAKGGRSLNSPVRIFTNVAGDRLTLPVDEGYRYCSSCARWTSPENRHCPKCNACTSKDGRRYVHCDRCGRCVKPTWSHCVECDRCALRQHPCHQFRRAAAAKRRAQTAEAPAEEPNHRPQVLEQPAEDWNRQAAEPEPEPDGSQRRAVELEQQQPQKLRRKVEEKVGPLEREAEKAKATTRWRVTNK